MSDANSQTIQAIPVVEVGSTRRSASVIHVMLQIISGIIACIAAVLAYSDQIKALSMIDPKFASYWSMVALAGTILSRVAAIIGDVLDDGKVNNSFGNSGLTISRAVVAVLYISALTGMGVFTVSCATETGNLIKDRNGRVTNAVLGEVFNAVVKVGLSQGANVLQGRNGVDASTALFESASSIDGAAALEHILRAAAGPEIRPVASVAVKQLAAVNPQNQKDIAAVVNTIGAAIQYANNQLPR